MSFRNSICINGYKIRLTFRPTQVLWLFNRTIKTNLFQMIFRFRFNGQLIYILSFEWLGRSNHIGMYCMFLLIERFGWMMCIFRVVLMKGQGWHTFFIFIIGNLLMLIVLLALLNILLLKVIIRKLYILNDFVNGLPFFTLSKNILGMAAFLHLPCHQLILLIPDILMINLNNITDFPLEYPGQFPMILIVLTEHDNLIRILIFLILSLQKLAILIVQYFILQKCYHRVMIIFIHLLDLQNTHGIIAVIQPPWTNWKIRIRLHRSQ